MNTTAVILEDISVPGTSNGVVIEESVTQPLGSKGLIFVRAPLRILKIIRETGRLSTEEALYILEVGLLNPQIEKLQSKELKTEWQQGPMAFLCSLSCFQELRQRVTMFAAEFFGGEENFEIAAGWLVVMGLGVDLSPLPPKTHNQVSVFLGPVWKQEVRPESILQSQRRQPPSLPPPPTQPRLPRIKQPVQRTKTEKPKPERQTVAEGVPTPQTLIELRLSTGLSQTETARELGIARSYLAEIERGVRDSPRTRKRMALFYSEKKAAQQNNG